MDQSAPPEAGESPDGCLQVGELRKPGAALSKKLRTSRPEDWRVQLCLDAE